VGWQTSPAEPLFEVKYPYGSRRATGVLIELRHHLSPNLVRNANILSSKPAPGTERNEEITQKESEDNTNGNRRQGILG